MGCFEAVRAILSVPYRRWRERRKLARLRRRDPFLYK